MSLTDPTTVLLLHAGRERELAARAAELRLLAELPAPPHRARRGTGALLRTWLTAAPRRDAHVAR